MELKGRIKEVKYNSVNERFTVSLETSTDVSNIFEEYKEKDIDVIIKRHRKKRSLDANAYFWVLVDKISKKIHSSLDRTYISLLKRYGVFTVVIVREIALNRLISEWRYTEVLGEVEVNGAKGIQVQCFFGSSTYDTVEMSRLIDGTVSEAKELGIDTISTEEIRKMKERWGI